MKYLSIVPFTKNDAPLLQDALLKQYPQNNFENNESIKNTLGEIIIDLKDSSSFTFARNNYVNSDDTTRNMLLTIMASFPTQENFSELRDILLDHTPRIEPGYLFTNALTDSLELAAQIFPELLPLLRDTVMTHTIIRLANKLSDSGLISRELLRRYQDDFIQLSKRYNAALIADPDNYDYVIFSLQEILAKLNAPATNEMLQNWSTCKNIWLQQNAVNLLLQNHQSISKEAIQVLAENKNTRIELYDSLTAYKKQKFFPSKYLTQKSLAECLVYAAGEDYDPTGISYVSDKIVEIQGTKSRFYFYKLTFGDGDDVHYILACAGPFPMNIKDMSINNSFGSIYEDEYFDSTRLDEQMKALIGQRKESLE